MSSSKSSSESASNVTDRRIGATDQAVVIAEGSQGNFNLTSNMESVDGYVVDRTSEVAERALITSAQIARDSLSTADSISGKAFGFGEEALDLSGDTFRQSLQTIENLVVESIRNVETANESVLDISGQAINQVEASTRSDAAQSFNKFLTFATVASIGAAVVFSVRK
jgi:hypothetical protein